MYRAVKIRVFNYFLSENQRTYQETGKGVSECAIRKYINNVLKKTTHKWLSEVSSNVMKQAVKDADVALKRFFKDISGYPKYKSRHKSKPSFYVNYESLKRLPNGFQGEKLGYVKTSESLPKIKGKYKNPHINFDGKYWYLSVSYEVKPLEVELTGASIGIDLGVKELAVLSTGKIYRNINKTAKVKKLKKRLKREQRKVSRRLEGNIAERDKTGKPIWKKPLRDCKNIARQNKKIRLIYKKLTDIRNMKYKCEWRGIEFVEVDRFYASSKTCSRCGHKKADLKLSDRIYKCSECGLVIDRDLNAAINLANYKIPNATGEYKPVERRTNESS